MEPIVTKPPQGEIGAFAFGRSKLFHDFFAKFRTLGGVRDVSVYPCQHIRNHAIKLVLVKPTHLFVNLLCFGGQSVPRIGQCFVGFVELRVWIWVGLKHGGLDCQLTQQLNLLLTVFLLAQGLHFVEDVGTISHNPTAFSNHLL